MKNEEQKKRQYAVHLYVPVRVKVVGISASSVKEALMIATADGGALDWVPDILNNSNRHYSPGGTEIVETEAQTDERVEYALVDPVDEDGEVIDGESQWLDADGDPLVDGQTKDERHAAQNKKSTLFMDEVLGKFDSLGVILEMENGPEIMMLLAYMQHAIASSSWVDVDLWNDNGEAEAFVGIIESLPSAEEWKKFMRAQCDMSLADRADSAPRMG